MKPWGRYRDRPEDDHFMLPWTLEPAAIIFTIIFAAVFFTADTGEERWGAGLAVAIAVVIVVVRRLDLWRSDDFRGR